LTVQASLLWSSEGRTKIALDIKTSASPKAGAVY
jgi:hypothetical protein